MPLPAPLLRQNPDAFKNQFGHVLILAGSRRMLGASALCGIAAMRSGAGLATLGVPVSLNAALQKKISPVLMTWPLPETLQQSFAFQGWAVIRPELQKFSAAALGPGVSLNAGTKRFVKAVIRHAALPLVIDADALNIAAEDPAILIKTQTVKILTPHLGEFCRLLNERKSRMQGITSKALEGLVRSFAARYQCVLVLKGSHTIVADMNGGFYVNRTGNAGMATAGSGDVLTGMIAAFLAQGLAPFEAARWGVHLHGKAGDAAARRIGQTGMIATDIIEDIPRVLKGKGR